MARIFTPAAADKAKAFMHDTLCLAGHLTDQRQAQSVYFSRYRVPPVQPATDISNELINRSFADIDQSIRTISNYQFYNKINGGKIASFKPEEIAKAIVYTAELLELYWDDTIRTPYEIDEFKKTLLGAAVFEYERYISAIKDKPTKTRATATAGVSRAASSAPQNGYKQSGPQSGNVRGLIGNPGEKVYADSSFSYRIEGDKVKTNVPRVFIKPLTASGADGSSSNKIYISSGNGYTDCTCYFDDPNEAQAFLDKIIPDLQKLINEKRAISDITNLHVAKLKSDSNGYFLVNTEYGRCAVSARTLNEAITEELKATSDNGWEKVAKRCTKEELDELHTWMRKD